MKKIKPILTIQDLIKIFKFSRKRAEKLMLGIHLQYSSYYLRNKKVYTKTTANINHVLEVLNLTLNDLDYYLEELHNHQK